MRERTTFEREMEDLRGATFAVRAIEGETFGGLRKRLTQLSLFPHWTGGGAAVQRSPGGDRPGSDRDDAVLIYLLVLNGKFHCLP
jgi:hypothetical protein